MKNSVFKSTEKRDKMRNYYKGVLSNFPFEQKYIETSYGQTFMLVAGHETNPPVILLHGSNSNSAFWFPEIMALSDNYRVYAVDIIGEAGNSAEYRPDLNTSDFAHWMKEVLTTLGLEKAHVIGNSLGGWMALKLAVSYPKCVSTLIIIASAGLAPVKQFFMQNVNDVRKDDGTVPITSDILGENELPKEVLQFMNLIAESYNPIQELPLFSDEQLLTLNMPVAFIGGEDDVIIDVKESVVRLTSLVPSAKVHLLQSCGHVITNSMEYILPHLKESI